MQPRGEPLEANHIFSFEEMTFSVTPPSHRQFYLTSTIGKTRKSFGEAWGSNVSWQTKTSLRFHLFRIPPYTPPHSWSNEAALILSSVAAQLGEAAAANSWQKCWDNILYIVERIYYALMDGKTDWSCCNNSKQKWRDWLRLIDSTRKWWWEKKKKKTQGDAFNFSSPATYLSLPDRKQLSFCWNVRSSFDTFAKAQPASRERQRMG